MNEHEPETDPGQEQAVRALLGEVGARARADPGRGVREARRHPGHAAGGAGRGTRAGRAGDPGEGDRTNVVPLRRKWLPRAAGAAAAVIVLGVGGLAAVRLGTDGSSKDSAASGGVASDTAPSSQAPSEAPVPSAGAGATPGSKARALRESAGAVRALPAVTTATFAADVTGLLRTGSALTTPCRTRRRPVRGRVRTPDRARRPSNPRRTSSSGPRPGSPARAPGPDGQRRSRGQPGAPRRDALRAAGPPGEGRRAAGRGVDLCR